MAHTTDIICYDPATGNLGMIVLLDDDRQLNDPAWQLPGQTQLRIPALNLALSTMGITVAAVQAAAAKGVTVQLASPTGATGATGATGPVV